MEQSRKTLLRWTALGAGALALCFSNGVSGNVVAAWLAPALLLGFVMSSGVWLGLAVMAAVLSAATFFMFRGAIPMPDAEFAVFSLVAGCVAALPFFLSRVVAPRLGGLAGSLVFPCLSTALGYIAAMGSPFGTWGHDAYMQQDFAPLAQLASVVGIWGVAFVVFWAASIVVALVTARGRATALSATVFALCFAAAIGFGAWRLYAPPAASGTVRIAALNNPADLPDRFFEGCDARDDLVCRTEKARSRWDRLFDMSAAAARDGARMVVWYEAAAQYDEHDEAEFLARAEAFVREHQIYLVAGAARVPNDTKGLIENKAMVFTPEGELAFAYLKSVPVPGEPIVAGDRRIRTLDTPYGRLGVMICFDADFPDLSRQAAARGVDILAVPANDWRAIAPLHGEMVRFRAIENGFSVVRASSNGLSIIADQRGVVLASVNSFVQPGVAAIANVPTQRMPTLYGEVDDQFAGVAILSALVLLLAALIVALRARFGASSAPAL